MTKNIKKVGSLLIVENCRPLYAAIGLKEMFMHKGSVREA
jgi:hypothetical protein